ncbi:MAG: hypothetical protein BZ138_07250, partial [Methanosphaera sp. rholeuAM270]
MVNARSGDYYNHYKLDEQSKEKYNIDEDKPYFYINGHPFEISTGAESKSEINIVKNKMYVHGKAWGYTDMQWTNFSGETLTIEVYSRTYERYKGDKVQPDQGGLPDNEIYPEDEKGIKLTPHGALKYWAQTFVTCKILTNLDAFESGDYKIDEFSQTNPDADFIVTKLTLMQYEKPGLEAQTYSQAGMINTEDTSELSA